MIETLRFLAAARRNFRSVGALTPSSSALGRAMVGKLGKVPPDQVLVELGPGTGVFTKVLRQAFPQQRVIAVEFDAQLAKRLQNRLPTVECVHGCATRLRDILFQCGVAPEQVGGVISGLPLLNFDDDLRTKIFDSLCSALPPGRRWVQFTYSSRAWRGISPPGFHRESTRKCYFNVPPATIFTFLRDR